MNDPPGGCSCRQVFSASGLADGAPAPCRWGPGRPPPATLRILGAHEWHLLREVRLRALRDAPKAFAVTYEGERERPAEYWKSLLQTQVWVSACLDGRVVGVAASTMEPREPGVRHLESVWVTPEHRNRGIARCMVCVLVSWERRRGADRFWLWVFEDNHAAKAAYRRMGFRLRAQDRQPMAGDGRIEEHMVLGEVIA